MAMRTVFWIPLRVGSVLADSWWECLMLACSFLGLFWSAYYSLCLLDVIPQLRYMSFLGTAISRNVGRIGLTLLLTIVILYLCAVFAVIFMPDEVSRVGV